MKLAQDVMIDMPLVKCTGTVTRARQILRDESFREIFVENEKRKVMGYIDVTDALRVTATRSNVTVEGFLKDAPLVRPDDPIEQVARMLRDYRTDTAGVVDAGDHFLGAVLLSDLFPIIVTRHEIGGIVADVMTRKVVTCAPEDPVQRIYSLMLESGYSAFPVMRKGKLMGIISRRDLLRDGRVRTAIENNTDIPVERLMTRKVITTAPDEPLTKVAGLLVKNDVSRMPVMERDALAGIIDRHDVLKGLR
ncbi:MAG: histidine kinase [Methanoregula sp.]|nr:MAG: histidine kinase [Methanoregula sp.]